MFCKSGKLSKNPIDETKHSQKYYLKTHKKLDNRVYNQILEKCETSEKRKSMFEKSIKYRVMEAMLRKKDLKIPESPELQISRFG